MAGRTCTVCSTVTRKLCRRLGLTRFDRQGRCVGQATASPVALLSSHIPTQQGVRQGRTSGQATSYHAGAAKKRANPTGHQDHDIEAKKAVARLRISLSFRSRRFSARNAANSSRSALVSPSVRAPASSSACFTQLHIRVARIAGGRPAPDQIYLRLRGIQRTIPDQIRNRRTRAVLAVAHQGSTQRSTSNATCFRKSGAAPWLMPIPRSHRQPHRQRPRHPPSTALKAGHGNPQPVSKIHRGGQRFSSVGLEMVRDGRRRRGCRACRAVIPGLLARSVAG